MHGDYGDYCIHANIYVYGKEIKFSERKQVGKCAMRQRVLVLLSIQQTNTHTHTSYTHTKERRRGKEKAVRVHSIQIHGRQARLVYKIGKQTKFLPSLAVSGA